MGLMLIVTAAESVLLGVPLSDFLLFPAWLGMSFIQLLIFLAVFYVAGFLIFFWHYPFARKGRGIHHFLSAWDQEVDAYIHSPRFTQGVVGALIATMVVAAFTIQKCYIPYFQTYSWDPEFAALDKAVHFGKYPHEWLTPVIMAMKATWLLDKVYILWFMIFYLLTGFALFCEKDPQHHMRYMWTFSLSLPVIGNYFATAMSSVGPIFYSTFYPDIPDPYVGLVTHLVEVSKTTPLLTFQNIQVLVDWVRNDRFVDFNSISAMPSVHVAVVWLLVLYCWKYNWFFRGLAIALFFLILVGSAYLGFHYMIDGYFSVVFVSIFWWFSGGVSKRLCAKPETC